MASSRRAEAPSHLEVPLGTQASNVVTALVIVADPTAEQNGWKTKRLPMLLPLERKRTHLFDGGHRRRSYRGPHADPGGGVAVFVVVSMTVVAQEPSYRSRQAHRIPHWMNLSPLGRR